MRLFLSWTVFLFTSISGFAQLTTLDSLTVTASRLPGSVKNSGKSVSTLRQAEISQIPVTSLDELLRYITGVHLNQRGAFGVQSDISMRGSTYAQVLVMIDNIRLNDPLTAHFNCNIPLTLSEIEQIEIVRGPATASFGADAVGGLIHIKTKTYMAGYGDSALLSNATVAAGSNQTGLAEVGIFQSGIKWRFSAGIRTTFAEGERYANPNYPDVSDQEFYNARFDIKTYSGSIGYTPSEDWKVYLRMGVDARDFNAKYFYTASPYDEAVETIKMLWTQAAVSKKWKNQLSSIYLGYKNNSDYFAFNPLFAPNRHRTFLYSANLNHRIYLNDQLQFVMGTQIEQKAIISTDRGNHENLNAGIYGITSYRFKDIYSTLGLRMEYNEVFGWEFVPQFNLAYNRGINTLRFSLGKGIRTADFTERYISHKLPFISPGRNIGNSRLDPERSLTADIGLDQTYKVFRLSTSIFLRQSRNLIDYVVTSGSEIHETVNFNPAEEYLYAQNISKTRVYGFEAELGKEWKLQNGKIRTGLAYTFIQTNTEDSVASKYIANHPVHSVSLMSMYHTRHFFSSISLNHIRRDPDKVEAIGGSVPASYSLLNLKIGWRISQDELGIMPFVQINNVLDSSYQEILGAQMPGRWFIFGLEKTIF